ncbi:MAG: SAM-dependent methyltransferase [Terrisporobacter othiniensis]|uniref:SAM-dependent methyltransferase n=1 Tax=Terrisporobacter petrolearius TaxID=1460447 RepID=UPI0022DF2191|nr:SAM-dependent methyltransferase [Terrisporobacter petrolearius]MDU4862416.1 SAM-dependent methyltransferase [Terrisporobacter othiniensis]MDU6993692.1 SAM-dependent methyltransferase [Terrisporobacter othiniensis]
MKEKYYDKLLNIDTIGNQNWKSTSTHNHPYEPTLYIALEELFENYKLKEDDHIVDFGCGMGRLIFYINYHFQSYAKGVEINERYYEEALINKINYKKKNKKYMDKINFYCDLAQQYKISYLDNKFYFFNPFSIQIFSKVIDNILESYENNIRDMDIIMYYPSNEYLDFLDYKTPFTLNKEVNLTKLYEKDHREKFVIYSLKC